MSYGVDGISLNPMQHPLPMEVILAKGHFPGHAVLQICGFNADADTAAEETIWPAGGLYENQSAAVALEVISSSTDDDGSPAGTGARTVQVTGLDASYAVISETVTLNGTTAVDLTTSFKHVNSFEVLTVGSDKSAKGNLTLRKDAAGATQAYIPATYSKAAQGVYTVPAGKTALITRIDCNSSIKGKIKVRTTSSAGLENIIYQQQIGAESRAASSPQFPIRVPEKTIIHFGFKADADNADVGLWAEILLIDADGTGL
jgi:hypothetical protein